ncbi:MAG: hypothetical protein HS122_17905 [Opitutaceae bacterium]|nr:hypothetical protein [Opitutaceae bacterium]
MVLKVRFDPFWPDRTNPGFIQGGRTLGGAPEFVVPNGPIPPGASTRIIGP